MFGKRDWPSAMTIDARIIFTETGDKSRYPTKKRLANSIEPRLDIKGYGILKGGLNKVILCEIS